MENMLKESRKRKGFSQKALSELSGVHWRTIQEWEGGSFPEAKLKNVVAVARALGCTIDELVGR